MRPAPPGPSRFGYETTREDIQARIEWEQWAADRAREEDGHEAIAGAHDMTRIAYEKLLAERFA